MTVLYEDQAYAALEGQRFDGTPGLDVLTRIRFALPKRLLKSKDAKASSFFFVPFGKA